MVFSDGSSEVANSEEPNEDDTIEESASPETGSIITAEEIGARLRALQIAHSYATETDQKNIINERLRALQIAYSHAA